MIKNLINIIAVASAVAFPAVKVQKAAEPTTGYKIYEGQYVSEILIGDIQHDYIGLEGHYELGAFEDVNTNNFFNIAVWINSGGIVYNSFISFNGEGYTLIDWEKSGLSFEPYYESRPYPLTKTNFCLYLKKPLKVLRSYPWTEKYLSYTSPAREFAAGYDGLIPSFYYTSISGNKSFLDSINSVSSLVQGKLWTSGDVSSLHIEKDDFIFQYYYVYASAEVTEQLYIVYLRAYAKSKDGQKVADYNISELANIDLHKNIRKVGSYIFPEPVSTLETKSGYYNILRSGGAYGLTDSVKKYEEGYKDGQENPTFKSFIVSAFEACSAFFSLPVLGEHITIGTLIGSFVGLGALFLLIRLFR